MPTSWLRSSGQVCSSAWRRDLWLHSRLITSLYLEESGIDTSAEYIDLNMVGPSEWRTRASRKNDLDYFRPFARAPFARSFGRSTPGSECHAAWCFDGRARAPGGGGIVGQGVRDVWSRQRGLLLHLERQWQDVRPSH